MSAMVTRRLAAAQSQAQSQAQPQPQPPQPQPAQPSPAKSRGRTSARARADPPPERRSRYAPLRSRPPPPPTAAAAAAAAASPPHSNPTLTSNPPTSRASTSTSQAPTPFQVPSRTPTHPPPPATTTKTTEPQHRRPRSTRHAPAQPQSHPQPSQPQPPTLPPTHTHAHRPPPGAKITYIDCTPAPAPAPIEGAITVADTPSITPSTTGPPPPPSQPQPRPPNAHSAKRSRVDAPNHPLPLPSTTTTTTTTTRQALLTGSDQVLAVSKVLSPPLKRRKGQAEKDLERPIRLPASSHVQPALRQMPYDDKDGHYIIIPGDQFTPRYKIIKQLGQGTFGKVVQAFDFTTRKHVAIKIIRAVDKYRDASKIELRVLSKLTALDPTGKQKCIQLLEWFDYRNHVCIVTPLLGQSVFDFLKANNFVPFPHCHIQSFAHQLLCSVAYMHSLRLIHTDLKPENILLCKTDSRLDHVQLRPGGSWRARRVLNSSEIRLIDFGSATFCDEYHSSVVSTRHYRAPEVILGLGWSYPCDIYSLGCIFIEFFTGEALYQTHDNLEHLAMMERVVGPMPSSMASRARKTKSEFFNKAGLLDYPNSETSKSSRKYLSTMKRLIDACKYDDRDPVKVHFFDLLKNLLEWDPSKRFTVEQALHHPYFGLRIEQ